MTPQLLNYLRADNAFRQIALYVHPDGKATYLFERVGDASRMVRAGVKALGGTHADRRQRTFGGEFEHEVAQPVEPTQNVFQGAPGALVTDDRRCGPGQGAKDRRP